ncbi:MAG TPA: YitT family protein [Ktedonobacterales bacterium]|nr:YitT family protein [Ktedonobacterales bacterium]
MSIENQATPDTNQPSPEQPARPDRPWLKRPRTILPIAARIALDYLVITVGVVIFNLSLDWFLIPNQIAAGGLSGVAVLLNAQLGWPVGPVFLALNVPLFLAGWRFLGGGAFVRRTLYATVLVGALVDPMAALAKPLTHDAVLATVYGGLVGGFGIGLVYRYRGSTGGTDIIALLVNRFTGISVGLGQLLADGLIVLASGIVLNLQLALYALIAIYLSTKVLDGVLEGFSNMRLAHIISDDPEPIIRAVLFKLNRGATILEGRGAYTRQERQIVLVAITQREISQLKEIVAEVDPEAFIIIGNAAEVLGHGFKQPPTPKGQR